MKHRAGSAIALVLGLLAVGCSDSNMVTGPAPTRTPSFFPPTATLVPARTPTPQPVSLHGTVTGTGFQGQTALLGIDVTVDGKPTVSTGNLGRYEVLGRPFGLTNARASDPRQNTSTVYFSPYSTTIDLVLGQNELNIDMGHLIIRPRLVGSSGPRSRSVSGRTFSRSRLDGRWRTWGWPTPTATAGSTRSLRLETRIPAPRLRRCGRWRWEAIDENRRTRELSGKGPLLLWHLGHAFAAAGQEGEPDAFSRTWRSQPAMSRPTRSLEAPSRDCGEIDAAEQIRKLRGRCQAL
jgi:hypothetical protein